MIDIILNKNRICNPGSIVKNIVDERILLKVNQIIYYYDSSNL